jgi:VCBS repeat-containing protein
VVSAAEGADTLAEIEFVQFADMTVSASALQDSTPPTVIGSSPTVSAVGVAIGSNIVVTFSEAVTRGTGKIEIRQGSATGTVVETFDAATSSRLTISGPTLTIDPKNDLGNGARYFVTFAPGSVKDLAGNGFAGTATYDFVTTTVYKPIDGATSTREDTAVSGVLSFAGDSANNSGNPLIAFENARFVASASKPEAVVDLVYRGTGTIDTASLDFKVNTSVTSVDVTTFAGSRVAAGNAASGVVAIVASPGFAPNEKIVRVSFGLAPGTSGFEFQLEPGSDSYITVSGNGANTRIFLDTLPPRTPVGTGIASFAKTSDPAHGTVTLNATSGAFTYSPEADFNGTDSFTFTVNDGTVDSASATIAITVNAVNDAPTVKAALPDLVIKELSSINLPIPLTTFGDVDQADTLTLAAAGLPTGLAFNAQTNTITGSPSTGTAGTYAVTISATDRAGASVSDLFVITVDKVGGTLSLKPYHWKTHAVIADPIVKIDSIPVAQTVQKSFVASSLSEGGHNVQVISNSADRESAITLKDALAALKLAIGVDGINASSTGATVSASPYQRAAADFNADGKVDLKDALEILKYSIGVTTANTPRWQFYDESEAIARGTKPTTDFSQEGKSVSVNANRSMNLVGVLTGDVDGSWAPPSGSATIDSQHFTSLVTSLQAANDTDVSLARWGIYG